MSGGVWFALICLGAASPWAQGFQHYADRIPNGHNVPHPCNPNIQWYGVGHNNPQGGGSRNPFGEAFAANNHQWTEELCKGDADQDGLSNGYELGDPDCVWTAAKTPARTTNITHPGICEPLNAPKCKQQHNFSCEDTGYHCPHFKNETDLRNTSIRLSLTDVPAQETTYLCEYKEFPDNETFDIIGLEPIIDNRYVMHHMLLWGCASGDVRDQYAKPSPCGMRPSGCHMLMEGWSLGNNGKCYPPHVGLRMGKDGWRHTVLQVHWNNPSLISGTQDSSGMLLHYTPHLRQYPQSTFLMGNIDFVVPARKAVHEQQVIMHPDCSRAKQTSSFHVHMVNLHMHYIGRKATLEQFRDGRLVQVIAKDDPYAYDYPVFHSLSPPVEVRVGDELRFTCRFDSSGRQNDTYFGEATADEMCFAFLFMTPEQPNFPDVDWKGIVDHCVSYLPQYGGSPGNLGFIGGSSCHYTSFTKRERPNMVTGVKANCAEASGCTPACVDVLRSYKNHACTQSQPEGLTQYLQRHSPLPADDKRHLEAMMEMCKNELEPKATPAPTSDCFVKSSAVCVSGHVHLLAGVTVLLSLYFSSHQTRC